MTPPQEWVARPAPAQSGAKRIIGGFLSEVELWAKEEREIGASWHEEGG